MRPCQQSHTIAVASQCEHPPSLPHLIAHTQLTSSVHGYIWLLKAVPERCSVARARTWEAAQLRYGA